MTAMLFTTFLSQDLKRRIILLLQECADFVAQIFGHVVDGFESLLDEGSVGDDAYKKYVGETLSILCEGRGRTDEKYLTGKSRQNIIVDFSGDDSLIGQFVSVKITKALNWALIGEIQQ